MQFAPLDPHSLSRLADSVLAHSVDQYRAALAVLRERPTPVSAPVIRYIEQCLGMVSDELARRAEAVTDEPGSDSSSPA